MSRAPSEDIPRFYEPNSTYTIPCGGRNVTLREILLWDDRRLESEHSYIQWLSQLHLPSNHNDASPLIDDNVFLTYRSDIRYRNQMRIVMARMASFYGYEMTFPAPNRRTNIALRADTDPQPNLGTSGNYNHLRISRILRSLRVLGLEREALQFKRCLIHDGSHPQPGGRIHPTALAWSYWNKTSDVNASIASYVEPSAAEGSLFGWATNYELIADDRDQKFPDI